MGKGVTFRAFFSYAHLDAEADPKLIEALTTALELRTNVQLVNDSFEIWRDTEELRLGDKWEPRIEEVLRGSDILIILLAPRWLGSKNCRKEYDIFKQVEAARGTADFTAGYIATILAREVKDALTTEQTAILASIQERQYQRVLATDFLTQPKSKRDKILSEIADDICGIIERRRASRDRAHVPQKTTHRRGALTEFDIRAVNYEEIDFVSNAEVLLDRRKIGESGVYAQVDFVPRLYVQRAHGRVEFGVRRARMTIVNGGPGELTKVRELKGGEAQRAWYVTYHETPNAITVQMDPQPGSPSIAELALPPSENENYLSRIAGATEEVATDRLSAELRVTLNVEGLYLPEAEQQRTTSRRTLMNIKAILDTAIAKAETNEDESIESTGKLRRRLRIGERA
jgi:hypothetical protein